ncbi:CrcB family protein [Nocardioides sp.]|uniref:fluoride efflux transporter FluC n=1 Tax=Nocardioides sp. TaxID=35761 RepID=UPI00273555F7|nr:CrcB family protein [Nocardioides sp.]MDP3891992.1 CrcB family protein [Nocardioides sp.]
MTLLLVALGAGVGAALRYTAGHLLDGAFPRGTLLVNVVGSTLLGALSALSLSGSAMALFGVGLCGGVTTFSSFAVQAHDRGRRLGTAYALLTVVLSLAGCFLGFLVAAQL